MKGAIESLTWFTDEKGHQFICSIDSDKKSIDDLSEDEQSQCTILENWYAELIQSQKQQ